MENFFKQNTSKDSGKDTTTQYLIGVGTGLFSIICNCLGCR
jgi:hypothetical protein